MDPLPALFDWTRLTDAGLVWLTRLPSLSHLKLVSCRRLTGGALEHIAAIPNLSALRLRGCRGIDWSAFGALAPLRGLRLLHAWGCGFPDDEGIEGVAARHPGLIDLDPGGGDAFTNRGLEALSVLPLERLAVRSGGVTDEGLAHLPVSLQSLTLHCEGLGDDGFRNLARLTRLTDLSFDGLGLTDETPWLLAPLDELQSLRLWSHTWPDAPATGDRLLEGVSRLASLRAIDVEGSFSPVGLAHLSALPRLRHLMLNSYSLEGLAPLAEVRTLEHLDLHRCGIGDGDLRPLVSIPQLKRLRLSHCGNLSDEALKVVARIRGLEALSLSSRRIGDAGLRHLCETNLRTLHLDQSPRVTPEGVAALAASMPGCWITS